MKSPRAEQFMGPMNASGNVLMESIHHKEPLTPEMDRRTANVLVIYDQMFGDEARSRAIRWSDLPLEEAEAGLQDGTWDPFSDDILRQQLGQDADDLDIILTDYT